MKTINIDLTPFLKPKKLKNEEILPELDKDISVNIEDEAQNKIQDKMNWPLKTNFKLNFPALDIFKKYELQIDSKCSNSIDNILNQSLGKAKKLIINYKRNLKVGTRNNQSPQNQNKIQISGQNKHKNFSLNYQDENNYSPKTNEANIDEEEKKLEESPYMNNKGIKKECNFTIQLSKSNRNNCNSEIKGSNIQKELKISINNSNQKHSHSCVKIDLQFSPTINIKSRKLDRKNLNRNKIEGPRWNILHKISKKNQISSKNENKNEDENCTFTPEINRSNSMTKDNVWLRFSKWSQEKQEKAKKIAQQIQFEEKKCCTFQPLINQLPKKSPTKLMNQTIDNFIEKKQLYAQEKAEKSQKISKKHFPTLKGSIRYKKEELQDEKNGIYK